MIRDKGGDDACRQQTKDEGEQWRDGAPCRILYASLKFGEGIVGTWEKHTRKT